MMRRCARSRETGRPRPADGQQVVLGLDLDVPGRESRHIGLEHEVGLRFADVDERRPAIGRRDPAEHIVEHPVDFAADSDHRCCHPVVRHKILLQPLALV